ncbi:hypothetical protein ZWY2020_034874 [Hordeum vulgare]|nr:hypothetical protein ZWY2020_034874 [Hordeum vulgare]
MPRTVAAPRHPRPPPASRTATRRPTSCSGSPLISPHTPRSDQVSPAVWPWDGEGHLRICDGGQTAVRFRPDGRPCAAGSKLHSSFPLRREDPSGSLAGPHRPVMAGLRGRAAGRGATSTQSEAGAPVAMVPPPAAAAAHAWTARFLETYSNFDS